MGLTPIVVKKKYEEWEGVNRQARQAVLVSLHTPSSDLFHPAYTYYIAFYYNNNEKILMMIIMIVIVILILIMMMIFSTMNG